MDSFWRIWKYVWPQWGRVLAVLLSVVIVSLLFSLSFMTVIPLLKVMMGEEGLHGWIDRSTCEWRYGMDFYVPDTTDILHSEEMLYGLKVLKVKRGGLAEQAGFKSSDVIVSVSEDSNNAVVAKELSTKVLEQLALASGDGFLKVNIRRISNAEVLSMQLIMRKPAGWLYDNAGFVARWQWGVKWVVMENVQKLLNFLPRDNSKQARKNAVILIIVAMMVITIFRCLGAFIQKYIGAKIVQVATAQLREELFEHAMYMPVGYFAAHGTSDAVSRMIGDVNGIGKGIRVLLGKSLQEPLKAVFMLACRDDIEFQVNADFFIACASCNISYGSFWQQDTQIFRQVSSQHGRYARQVAGDSVVSSCSQGI